MAETTAATDLTPCPGCHRLRPLDVPQCPHCGLPLSGQLAARLRHVDDELRGLAAAMSYPASSTPAHYGATPAQITQRYRDLLAERGEILQELYAEAGRTLPQATTEASAVGPDTPSGGNDGESVAAAESSNSPGNLWIPDDTGQAAQRSDGSETSPRFVQNTLLALGGVLLSAAAIGFTAVAWPDLGLAARTGILVGASLLMLAIPLLLARRGLRATAETTAVVWVLLLILDTVAARRADLVASSLNGFGYSALALAAVALLATGYGAFARLSSPRLTAIVMAHGIPPLLALAVSRTALAYAVGAAVVVAGGVAAVGLAARRAGLLAPTPPAEPPQPGYMRRAPAKQLGTAAILGTPTWLICVLGGSLAALSGSVAGLAELVARVSAGRGVGGALVIAAIAVLGGFSGALTRGRSWAGLSAALVPLVIWIDIGSLTLRMSEKFSLAIAFGAMVGLAAAVSAALQPQRLRTGATVGASLILGLNAVPLAVWTLLAAWGPSGRTDSVWSRVSDVGTPMLCGVVLCCVAWAVLQWRWRPTYAGLETAVGPALVAIAIFTTSIGPISNAPALLLVALPLCGAVMITGMGVLDTGITREGTFAAGLLLACNAALRGGQSGAGALSITLALLCVMYALVACATASGGVRVTATTVSSAALLGLAGPLTAMADGGDEILAAYLLLLGVIVLIAVAAGLATFGEASAVPPSIAMETMAAVGGLFAFTLSLHSALDSALMITTFCVLLAAMSIRESRRPAVWWALGLSVLAVALWLRAGSVSTMEGYTIPLALALLIIAGIVYRRRPAQTSWVTFGPALLLGIGPSLGLVLFAEASPTRALLLGIAALGITTIGAFTGRQAPFVLGAVTVATAAVRIVIPLLPHLSADLPTWIPLAGAGLLLVVVGASYERGRRDVRRLVGVIRRME